MINGWIDDDYPDVKEHVINEVLDLVGSVADCQPDNGSTAWDLRKVALINKVRELLENEL